MRSRINAKKLFVNTMIIVVGVSGNILPMMLNSITNRNMFLIHLKKKELISKIWNLLSLLIKPDSTGRRFAIPPDAHELRTELAILPLCYDSESRLKLPPKNPTAGSNTSIRQLLKRSPDRLDSLVLAVWGLIHVDVDCPVIWEPIIASGSQDDSDEPMTQAEIDELPDYLRDLVTGFPVDWDDDFDDEFDDEFDGTIVNSWDEMADEIRRNISDYL